MTGDGRAIELAGHHTRPDWVWLDRERSPLVRRVSAEFRDNGDRYGSLHTPSTPHAIAPCPEIYAAS
ncbi:hypothetical protein H6G52_05320 [Limnothrix sp. FACHB-881]|uniref:hypothetical protein n=1 Tax=Limnothrix sp. FACHB-881 TaxID=2692819 RepID=UPI0016826488|nr:hypothetical protein [Limnothrix sp. FACHB-881]MBD2634773.1 hypothetical protein [Limnothrix sp. FACHB-881]